MEKERQMFALVEAWEKSGQPQPDFCAQHHISLSKFGYWRSKWLALQSSSSAEPPSFIEIEGPPSSQTKKNVRVSTPAEVQGYEIIYPNGVRLCLPELDLSVLPHLLGFNV